MKLRFQAHAGAMVREHGVHRYYGYQYSADTKSFALNPQPFEVDSDSPDGDKCAKACREGSLIAANAETARACGVAFAGKPDSKKEAS